MSAVIRSWSAGIRQMSQDDLTAVLAIEEKCYEFPWTEGIFRDCLRVGYHCWVYEQEQEVVGYAIMSVAVGEAHVLNVCVDRDKRSNGIGETLMKRLFAEAVRYGADTILLEVRPSNVAAVKLYERLAFVEVGMRRAYYPAKNGREDALILAKQLVFPKPHDEL